MKKVLFFLMLIFSTFIYADIYVNGVDLNSTEAHYLKVEIEYNLGKTIAYVDYGQDESLRHRRVTDEKNEKRYFDSVADVLNTFYNNGWKIEEVFIVPSGGSDNSSINGTTYYILERMTTK
jgi:homoserine dehydrogenase